MSRALPLVPVLALSAILACRPPSSTGDSPASPSPSTATATALPEYASLLRRLAEAADGFRDNRPRFVVAGRRFPHPVAGVFEDRYQADSALGPLSGDTMNYEVFGPYRSAELPAEVVEVDEVVDTVIVITRGGERKTFLGDRVDALFWGLPAFDKFIAPYLAATGGPRYAAEQRELYRRGESPLARSAVVPHYRSSF
jgi:hypothetical protein